MFCCKRCITCSRLYWLLAVAKVLQLRSGLAACLTIHEVCGHIWRPRRARESAWPWALEQAIWTLTNKRYSCYLTTKHPTECIFGPEAWSNIGSEAPVRQVPS